MGVTGMGTLIGVGWTEGSVDTQIDGTVVRARKKGFVVQQGIVFQWWHARGLDMCRDEQKDKENKGILDHFYLEAEVILGQLFGVMV